MRPYGPHGQSHTDVCSERSQFDRCALSTAVTGTWLFCADTVEALEARVANQRMEMASAESACEELRAGEEQGDRRLQAAVSAHRKAEQCGAFATC